jgi:predicted AlkP superfamily phosphohydrolase/phosphomutase
MSSGRARRVLVIGLDGLEPSIVEPMVAAGELPSLARIRDRGGYSRLATTFPAQTPVAWSSFATGTNPGGHGIFDFLRRDPATYLPDLALNRYEQKNAFTPPKAVNSRGGEPFWEVLGRAGIPSTVIRCPCTYPGEIGKGRLLSGLGVPDIRGGLGTTTFYTERDDVHAGESERVIRVRFSGDVARTEVVGPRNPKGGELTADLTITVDREGGGAVLATRDSRLATVLQQWSDWTKVKFKVGFMQSISGVVRFNLTSLQPFELHASPVNFAPDAPMFPISAPWDYAGELEDELGTYYTAGMVEDHTGLMNGRLDEHAFLSQCDLVMREREGMLQHELGRFTEGFLFCLFDTPDRIQHMFWRFGEPEHPANRGVASDEFTEVIRDHYRDCDAVVGRALDALGDDVLVFVCSDHGFTSFQRGLHINGWLRANRFLALKPGATGEEFLKEVDWSRTKAYALGLGGIYLNRGGREASGILDDASAVEAARDIARGLTGLVDVERGDRAVERVVTKEEIYSGPFASQAPDLLVCTSRGYRASWTTALGGAPDSIFEDNTRRWGGDHIIDPSLVPGVLFSSNPIERVNPSIIDLAPTILAAFGVSESPALEGRSLAL